MAVMASPGVREVIQRGPSAMYEQAGLPGWLSTIFGMATPDPFTGPMGGFGMALGGPKIRVPNALQRILGMGEEAAQTVPQWNKLERPWSGIYKRGLSEGREVPSRSWQNPNTYEMPVEPELRGSSLTRFLQEMGPQVDLNDPGLVRNADLFRNLGYFGD